MAAAKTAPAVRLASIRIENYKALDSLSLDLPPPSTPDELDAFVLGSKNGVGKSSVLECCALSMVTAPFLLLLNDKGYTQDGMAPFASLVRAGEEKAVVRAMVSVDGADHQVGFDLLESGLKAYGASALRTVFTPARRAGPYDVGELFGSLLAMNSEPLLFPPMLLFHSYRKVLEGTSELSDLRNTRYPVRQITSRLFGSVAPLSTFKAVLVQALMGRSGLFEGVTSKAEHELIIDKLNGLMRDFAGGVVDKLRAGPGNSLELRVAPVGGTASFSFDGLSSGQKEIIATLFLIWYTTAQQPSVVLIDEPELHLNAEWQRIFVHTLAELAPRNQYLLATHSEEIFGSVPESRRLLLQGA